MVVEHELPIEPCRICGQVPFVQTIQQGCYVVACNMFACSNPNVFFGSTPDNAIHAWNEDNKIGR